MEDKQLIMDLLHNERAWTEWTLDDDDIETFDDEVERIYLARLNAEIARRCSS